MQNSTSKLPPRAPRYRSLLRLQRFMKNPIPFMDENLERYGETYCFSLRHNKTNILTINPDIIQHVLRKNSQNYEKPAARLDVLGEFIGKGLLIATGEHHTQQRRIIQPSFHRKKLTKLVDILDAEIEHYFEQLNQDIAKEKSVELNETFRKMTFRLMAKSIFGESMSADDTQRFFKNFTTLQDFLNQLARMPSLLKLYNATGRTGTYSKLAQENNSLLQGIIESRRKDNTEQDDILDMLLKSVYEDSKTGMSDETLREECLVLFVAGHETASNILAWTFYLLQQNPDATTKILAEKQAICGERTPTFDELLQMEYLMRVIFESMRIYPPSWITGRIAKEDDEIEGVFIPKGSRVISFIYGLHHSKHHWDAPKSFNPERFTKEQMKTRHRFAHIPFGAGPRMCIGRNFALLEMQMIILKMLENYRLDLLKGQRIELLPAITLKPRYGIHMKLEQKKISWTV